MGELYGGREAEIGRSLKSKRFVFLTRNELRGNFLPAQSFYVNIHFQFSQHPFQSARPNQ